MSKKYVISDLHLGHNNIIKFSKGLRFGENIEEHDQWIIDQWNSVVTKQDLVYVLGDVSMTKKGLELVKKLKGSKHLVKGNHDIESIDTYKQYFSAIYGLHNYRRVFWMSHAPIHPDSLRQMFNLHGHTHQTLVKMDNGDINPRYINCCVEMSYGVPQSLDDLYDKYLPLVKEIREKNEQN